MGRINVLDCTLRDGGYCNQWRFGFHNTKKIIERLIESNVDIIECGFITNRIEYDSDVTKFTNVEQIAEIMPINRGNKLFAVMMNYGEYSITDLPENDGTSIDGIRVAFHKKDAADALNLCEGIKKKGYKVFIQGMVSLCYSDEEFLTMIQRVNEIEPYAFYIVDSFGEMKKNDLTRLFYLVEHNLNKSIQIGFHSHNNLQLSYSNAQSLVDLHSKRQLIIDSSIYGMGRGAGNLNTELFVQYLNDNGEGDYNLKPLLNVIDEILDGFYQNNRWGYSLPNYLSADHHVHPNYAAYLDDKKTLTVENINAIFELMDEDKKVTYDKEYIQNLYVRFMETGRTYNEHKEELIRLLSGKMVLLIAAGKSSVDEKEKILDFSKKRDVVTVSVNYDYPHVNTNFIFLSNLRRYRELDMSVRKKCIVTSNIPADGVYLQTQYRELLADEETVKDNASMMAIKYLISLGVKCIYLAGLDGYVHDGAENFGDKGMSVVMKNAVLDAMNESMQRTLKHYKEMVEIKFLTSPKHIVIY